MSLNIFAIGCGEGGSKLAAANIVDNVNVCVINTSKQDLDSLVSVQESKKYLIDVGIGGTGKNPRFIKETLENSPELKTQIIEFIKRVMESTPLYSVCPYCHIKNKLSDSERIGEYHQCNQCNNKFGITEINKEEKTRYDYILLFVSLGGGSGSGMATVLTDILCSEFNIPVGVVASIPSTDEDNITKQNAMAVFRNLYNTYAVKELISPLLLVDNEKMLQIYNLPVGKIFTVVNRVVAKTINKFNSFSSQISQIGQTLDPMDTMRLFSLGGCASIGKFVVGNPTSESTKFDYKVSNPMVDKELIDKAIEECSFVSGFDLSTAKGVGIVAVAPEHFLGDPNISDFIKYTFGKVKNIIGSGLVFRGQYTDNSLDCLEFYIMFNGLKFPEKRFAQMWEDIKIGKVISKRKQDRVDEVSYDIDIETDTIGKSFQKIQNRNQEQIQVSEIKKIKQNQVKKLCNNCNNLGQYNGRGPMPYTGKICPLCNGSQKI